MPVTLSNYSSAECELHQICFRLSFFAKHIFQTSRENFYHSIAFFAQTKELVSTTEHDCNLEVLKQNLERACDLYTTFANSGPSICNSYTDASYYAAGCVFMTEEYTLDQQEKITKLHNTVSFDSKTFRPAIHKLSSY